MRASTLVMIGFAVVFGLIAVFLAQTWLTSQADMRMKSLEAGKKPVASRTIVVAKEPLRYGTELAAQHLVEVAWATEAAPAGAFSTVAELLAGGKRIVLSPIEPSEPVLAIKITGPGQRATLSALVGPGMKAVAIRVNDIEGVGGFVLPGDRVDIVLTRQLEKGAATTEVVLQNARVLAIDQMADERSSKPSVAKAVTVEVDTVAAQKLALASSVGSLSLLLRKAGETAASNTRAVTLKDLGNGAVVETSGATVGVTRGGTLRQEYTVPFSGESKDAVVSGGRRLVR